MLVTKLLGFPQVLGFESESGSAADIQGKNCRQQRHPAQAIYLTTTTRPAAPTTMSAQDIPIRIAIRMTVRLMSAARSYPLNGSIPQFERTLNRPISVTPHFAHSNIRFSEWPAPKLTPCQSHADRTSRATRTLDGQANKK